MASTVTQAADASLTRSELETPGIRRRRRGRAFRYLATDGAPLTDKVAIARIKALVIPPAWGEVWICPREDGHIQAVGPTWPAAASTGTTIGGASSRTG